MPQEQFDISSLSTQQYLQLLSAKAKLSNNHVDIHLWNTMPPQQDEAVWQYEQLRFFCLQLNDLVIALHDSVDETTSTITKGCACPEMKAGDFEFLCAAHQTPQNV